MSKHGSDEDFYKGTSVFLAFVVTVLLVILFFSFKDDSGAPTIDSIDNDGTTLINDGKKDKPSKSKMKQTTTCVDVTSIDYNWDNDVLCTNQDGSEFYTDYAGGRKNDPSFQQN